MTISGSSLCRFVALPSLCIVGLAQQGQPVAGYKLLTTVPVPGGLSGFDISWADPNNARYYLADRGNANATPAIPARIDVIDSEHDQYLTSIPLSAAANGVVAIPRAHELWIGLSDSTVAVVSTDNYSLKQVISTGGKARADELAYDPEDRLILIANDRDAPPFVSLIFADTYTVVKTIPFDGVSAPQSTGGLEQSVWDSATAKFYLAVPATKANPHGEIDEIDPVSMSVISSIPTDCSGPAGLVLIPNQHLMTSCGDVVDIGAGKVLTTVKGVGGDEIWYNPGDERVYFGGGTDRVTVSVVDANSYHLLTGLTVGQIMTAPAVSQTTHSVAADANTNQVFVPVSGVGVQVWRNGATLSAIPNPVAAAAGADGTALVTWNAPNADTIEIHVGSPSGELFVRSGNRGAARTGTWVYDGLTLYLQDVTGGKALTADNTLASVVVHLQRP